MLTDSGFKKEMSYQGRIIILSYIYFTSIVLQTNRVKERVFNMSCFDRFNETET